MGIGLTGRSPSYHDASSLALVRSLPSYNARLFESPLPFLIRPARPSQHTNTRDGPSCPGHEFTHRVNALFTTNTSESIISFAHGVNASGALLDRHIQDKAARTVLRRA